MFTTYNLQLTYNLLATYKHIFHILSSEMQVISLISEFFKMDKIKRKFEMTKKKVKNKIQDYFRMENSMKKLIKLSKRYYVSSIGFDDISLGIWNKKRIVINIVFCLVMWIMTLYHLLLTISDKFYSFIDGPFLPQHFRTLICYAFFMLFLTTSLKTEYLYTEVKFKSKSPFKIFYFLLINCDHQLIQKNYKKLSKIIRILEIILIDYGIPFFSILVLMIFMKISFEAKSLVWLLQLILVTPFYIAIALNQLPLICALITVFVYYKMRFDQINHKFEMIVNNGLKKIKRDENQIIKLIHQHNLLAIEIDHLNVCMRKGTAMMFITLALIKVITLYLLIKIQELTLIKFLVINVFTGFFIIGFGLSILYSRQIKSAHQSFKLIHTVVCKYKINFKFKLKVNKLIFKT